MSYCIKYVNSNKLTNVLRSLTKTINLYKCLCIFNIKSVRSINYDFISVLAKINVRIHRRVNEKWTI